MIVSPNRIKPGSSRVVRSAMLTLVAFAVAMVLIIGALAVTYTLSPLSRDPKAPLQVVVVKRGMNEKQIGDMLQQKHLIRRAAGFPFAARIEGLNGKMVAGTYEFNPSMTPRAMAWAIALGRTAQDFVTIPEGFTVRQIAKRLAAKHMADEHSFLAMALTQGTSFRLGANAAPRNLEGYLFPDTYRIPQGTGERGIIQMMLDEFNARVLKLDSGYLAKNPGKLGNVIKLASLVEGEAEVDGDRPKIAAALSNRLRIGMRLQCDASIEYVLPAHKKRLYYKDLKVNSAYNTYLHEGLPPTPIDNPGTPSILAAMHPSKASYLFYVARPDGSHIFSETLKQHDQAIAMLRRQTAGRS